MFHSFCQQVYRYKLEEKSELFKVVVLLSLMIFLFIEAATLKQSSALAKWGNPWKREIIILHPTIFFSILVHCLASFPSNVSSQNILRFIWIYWKKVSFETLRTRIFCRQKLDQDSNFRRAELTEKTMSLTDFQIQLGKRLSIYYLHSILEKSGGSTKTSKQF